MALPRSAREQIMAHCQRQYPKEACGLLAGADGIVQQVYSMRNVEESPIGYAMDPKEQLGVERAMRSRAQQLIGIYHSHTASSAYPSTVDVRLAISPDISYLIISLKDHATPVVQSYRIEGEQVRPEAIQVV